MRNLVYGSEPAVAIFADGEPGLAHAAACVAAVGARVGARAPLTDALARLDLQATDAVMVMAGGAPEDEVAPLLDRLNEEAEAGRFGSVVVLPEALIDLAAARAPHENVSLVCGGGPVEELVALQLALVAHPPLVLEERGDESPGQLRRLREKVGRIARALAQMSGEEARIAAPPFVTVPVESKAGRVPLAPTLRTLIRARRQRDQYFAADLFADPAWDMLLDLMLARAEGRLVAVSSLCIAAAVPPTTALRWIKRLTDEGLFIRSADPRDGRRVFIDLSEPCADRMGAYLQAIAATGAAAA